MPVGHHYLFRTSPFLSPFQELDILASWHHTLTDSNPQPVIRLYSVPLSAFTAEDEDDIEEEEEVEI